MLDNSGGALLPPLHGQFRGTIRRALPLAGAVALGLLILVIRRPEAIVRPQFLGEEAAAFYAATFVLNPVEAIATSWNGFIYLGPRLAFAVSRLVPPPYAPVAVFVLFGLGLAWTALYLGGGRMAVAIPDARVRWFGALAVFLLPFAAGEYASVLQITWWWAILVGALLLATDPRSPAERWMDRAVATATAFTGPAAILMAPLYLARRRKRIDLTAIVCAGAAVQLLAFVNSPRRPAEGVDPIQIPIILVERIGALPLGDILGHDFFHLAHRVLLITLAPILISLLWAARSLPRRTLLVFGYLALAIPIMGSIAVPTADLRGTIGGARYFIPLAWLMMTIAVAALVDRRPPAVILAGAFALGLAFSWRGWPFDDTNWAQHAYCIGSPLPCVVPMTPTTWNVHWPGNSGFRVPAASGPLGGPVYP
jgi:hypothetical protein